MQQATAIEVKSCKEMGGATSVMPAISSDGQKLTKKLPTNSLIYFLS